MYSQIVANSNHKNLQQCALRKFNSIFISNIFLNSGQFLYLIRFDLKTNRKKQEKMNKSKKNESSKAPSSNIPTINERLGK